MFPSFPEGNKEEEFCFRKKREKDSFLKKTKGKRFDKIKPCSFFVVHDPASLDGWVRKRLDSGSKGPGFETRA